MGRIKAIETRYDGYVFRSRLEARWAVFFKYLKIKYVYEPEGFVLDDGTYYLPDFYLPEFNVMVEIKPSRDRDDGKARKFGLSEAYCGFGEGCYGGILICYGDPVDHDLRFISACESSESGCMDYDTDDMDNPKPYFCADGSSSNEKWEAFIFIHDGKTERCFANTDRVLTWYYYVRSPYFQKYLPEDNKIVMQAAKAARQARFEHGQHGAVFRNNGA